MIKTVACVEVVPTNTETLQQVYCRLTCGFQTGSPARKQHSQTSPADYKSAATVKRWLGVDRLKQCQHFVPGAGRQILTQQPVGTVDLEPIAVTQRLKHALVLVYKRPLAHYKEPGTVSLLD